jgi:hypothetical protein
MLVAQSAARFSRLSDDVQEEARIQAAARLGFSTGRPSSVKWGTPPGVGMASALYRSRFAPRVVGAPGETQEVKPYAVLLLVVEGVVRDLVKSIVFLSLVVTLPVYVTTSLILLSCNNDPACDEIRRRVAEVTADLKPDAFPWTATYVVLLILYVWQGLKVLAALNDPTRDGTDLESQSPLARLAGSASRLHGFLAASPHLVRRAAGAPIRAIMTVVAPLVALAVWLTLLALWAFYLWLAPKAVAIALSFWEWWLSMLPHENPPPSPPSPPPAPPSPPTSPAPPPPPAPPPAPDPPNPSPPPSPPPPPSTPGVAALMPMLIMAGTAVGGLVAVVVLGYGMYKVAGVVAEKLSKVSLLSASAPRSDEKFGPGPTDVTKCTVVGEDGSKKLRAEVGVRGMFTIEARNSKGERRSEGGDLFVVSIRGFSAVEDDTQDAGDGTYPVAFNCPGPSGMYKVTIMLDGVQLKGSPFKLKVAPASNPYAGAAPEPDKKKKKKKKGTGKKKLKADAAAAAAGAAGASPGKKPASPGKDGAAKKPASPGGKPESDSETSEEDDSPGTSDSSDDEKAKN